MSAPLTDIGNFAHLLKRAAERFGGKPAIVDRDGSTSFAELAARAGGIAERLREAHVAPGDRCAVLVRNPADAAAAFFAVLATGGVGINVNELYRPRQIEYVLGHSKAAALITADDVLATLPRPLETRARVVRAGGESQTAGEFRVLECDAEAPAQITYTSGSTGLPKGVVMSHRNLWAGVRVVANYLGLADSDRIAGLLPFSFVYGFNQLTGALYSGATLVVDRSTLAQQMVATLRRERVTVLAAVPPLWQQLLNVPSFRNEPLPDLRIITNAGGRLAPARVRELRASQPQARLFLMYGLTEVFRSTYLPPEEVDDHPDSMGRAVPESTIYVVREDGTLADTNEVGQLVHGGPTVGLGYLDDPEATARVFRANPFRTAGGADPERVVYSGDLVRRDEAGRLYYVSRGDRMVKTLGYRVSPDEVCDVVEASGEVAEAVVVAEPDPIRGERLVACVVLRAGGSLDRLKRFCDVELPRYMQPARFAPMASIPRNASGKFDLVALRATLEDRGAERA